MLEIFLSYLLLYKYLVLFGIAFSASLILPLPAAAVLMAAGAFSSQGYLDLKQVLLVGSVGNILGDLTSYTLTINFGRNLLKKIGLGKILQSKQFAYVEKRFMSHQLSTVFLSRFLVPALGTTVNILAGLYKVDWKSFLLCVIPGEIIYICFFAGLGFVFGDQWESIVEIVENIYTICGIATALVIISIYYFNKYQKQRAK